MASSSSQDQDSTQVSWHSTTSRKINKFTVTSLKTLEQLEKMSAEAETDAPTQSDQNFKGTAKTTGPEGTTNGSCTAGCAGRSTTNSDYSSSQSSFGTWNSDQQSSTGYSRPDTGYSSLSPAVNSSGHSPILSSVDEVKTSVSVDIDATIIVSEQKPKKRRKEPVVVDYAKIRSVGSLTWISEKLQIDRTPVPNYFAGKFYGYLLVEMASIAVDGVYEYFLENPEKFFKRSDRKWYSKAMPLLFGKSHKSPADVVKNLRETLIILDKLPQPRLDKDGNIVTDKKYDKALEEVSKNVAMIKAFIYGSDQSETGGDQGVQVAQLAQEVYNANILPMLVKMLPKFEFECKKDVGHVFNNLLRRQIGNRSPTVEYLGARPEILITLVQGYSVPDIAQTCGLMLRECIRHDHLAKMILNSEVFYTFFLYVQSEVFDISSDAFSTFKDLTTRHKAICAEFLEQNYDTFFAQYQNLLNSKNYVTRRQSLKLLGELLLDRHNFNIMTKYISNPENLKLLMELLRDKSRNIQYEAFHVFKVFVANPNKPKAISEILNRNRERLVEFLGEFHNDRTDDEQFNDEKAYLIKQIQEMKSSPKKPKKEDEQSGEPSTSEH